MFTHNYSYLCCYFEIVILLLLWIKIKICFLMVLVTPMKVSQPPKVSMTHIGWETCYRETGRFSPAIPEIIPSPQLQVILGDERLEKEVKGWLTCDWHVMQNPAWDGTWHQDSYYKVTHISVTNLHALYKQAQYTQQFNLVGLWWNQSLIDIWGDKMFICFSLGLKRPDNPSSVPQSHKVAG